MKKINVDALFLGPKAENREFFKTTLDFMMDEHIHWRRNFHPEDKDAVTLKEMRGESFEDTLDRTKEVLMELSDRLKASSVPWHSPRYLGHMNSDILMSATLAYMSTILYNPNNTAGEASPATTILELEAGTEMARMMGYDPDQSWGHITSGGHVANFEGLWFMRNLKSFPLGVKAVDPQAVDNKSDWELLNMPPRDIFDLISSTKEQGIFDKAREHSVRFIGMDAAKLGKLIVPQSRHYSWDKAVDVLGLGINNLAKVQVGRDFRMDMGRLRETIDDMIKKKIPIMGVVAVTGSTEEGSVDQVHEVLKIREEVEATGVSFYLHVDAAYGGYTRAVFLDENHEFMPNNDMKGTLHEEKVIHKSVDWPSKDVYEAFKAIPQAESVTVDPHKMGYVPYSAGIIVARDKRVTDLVSYFSPYVWTKGQEEGHALLLGSFIMEGSKAGATAAAVWTAHNVIPMNIKGYGRVVGRSLEAANRFYESLNAQQPFEADNGRTYEVATLTKPDFNLVAFAFNEKGNTDLKKMNDLTVALYGKCSYVGGPVYFDSFLTSHTEFSPDSYGDAPLDFISRLGMPAAEYEKAGAVWVLRACILTPFLRHNTTYDDYYQRFINIMKKLLAEVDKT